VYKTAYVFDVAGLGRCYGFCSTTSHQFMMFSLLNLSFLCRCSIGESQSRCV
jgi:hypothetical protein